MVVEESVELPVVSLEPVVCDVPVELVEEAASPVVEVPTAPVPAVTSVESIFL